MTFTELKSKWWYRVLQVLSVFYLLAVVCIGAYVVLDNYATIADPENYVDLSDARSPEEKMARKAIKENISRDDLAQSVVAYLSTDDDFKETSKEIKTEALQTVLDAYDKYRDEKFRIELNEVTLKWAHEYILNTAIVVPSLIILWYILRLIFLYVITGKIIWWDVKGEINVDAEIEKLERYKREQRLSQMLEDLKSETSDQ